MQRVEEIIRLQASNHNAEDDFERWMDLPMMPDSKDARIIWYLEKTVESITMTCVEEASILRDELHGRSQMMPEFVDLNHEIRYWMKRKDAMVTSWKDDLSKDGGLVPRWQSAQNGDGNTVYPTEEEEVVLQLLLRESLLGPLPFESFAPTSSHLPNLFNTHDLMQLLLGQPRNGSLIKTQIVGGCVIRLRNKFYHHRRVSDLLRLIHFLLPPSPCPPLQGKVIVTLLCAARNPDQFVHILIALSRLPKPSTPATFDSSIRRVLFHFAEDARVTRWNHLITPNCYPEGGGFKGFLLAMLDRWGAGLPENVDLTDKVRVRRIKRRRGDEWRLIKHTAPILLSQKTLGKHLEENRRVRRISIEASFKNRTRTRK